MKQYDFYKTSKYLISGIIGLTLIIGMLTTGKGGRSNFMENPLTMKVIATCIFLLGLHLLAFSQRWTQDNINYVKKFLENKPRFVRAWLAVHESYSFSRTIVIIAGFFALIWGAMFFVLSFKY
jgi:uncharacterized protein (DUF2062 family)